MASQNQNDSSDDENDPYILKMKAAAANKIPIATTSSIKHLIPSVFEEESKANKKKKPVDDDFFAHANVVLARENFRLQKVAKKVVDGGQNNGETINVEESNDADESVDDEEIKAGTDGKPSLNRDVASEDQSSKTESISSDDDTIDRIETNTAPISAPDIVDFVDFVDLVDDGEPQPLTNQSSVISLPEEEDPVIIRVKVDGRFEKFSVKNDDKLEVIFKDLSQRLQISIKDFSLLHDCDYLSPTITIGELLSGTGCFGILEFERLAPESPQSISNPNKRKAHDENCIKLKFQYGGQKCSVEMVVNKHDSFEIIKTNYIKQRDLDAAVFAKKLRFIFDGDQIAMTSTPDELELEEDDCVDVL